MRTRECIVANSPLGPTEKEDNAPPLVGLMGAAMESYIKLFNLSRPEDWEVYVQRFKYFVNAADIMDADKQRSTFLSRCGLGTFQLAKALVAPAQLKATTRQHHGQGHCSRGCGSGG